MHRVKGEGHALFPGWKGSVHLTCSGLGVRWGAPGALGQPERTAGGGLSQTNEDQGRPAEALRPTQIPRHGSYLSAWAAPFYFIIKHFKFRIYLGVLLLYNVLN